MRPLLRQLLSGGSATNHTVDAPTEALRAAAAADWGDAEGIPGARAVLDAIASF